MTDGMMWGMGLIGLLVLILIVLGIAALVKFLFSRNPRRRNPGITRVSPSRSAWRGGM